MRHKIDRVQRSGYVYKLYKENIIHLWIITAVLLLGVVAIGANSADYLMNYLVYRREPDPAALTAFVSRDMLDYDYVMADIEANGGSMILNRQATSMFYRDNVYQEGSRYRFGMEIDPQKLTDTGIYYDELANAYSGIWDRAQLKEAISRENYPDVHLYFYDYNGMELLLAVDYDKELEEDFLGKQRVTFAPIGVYSVYMIYDLNKAGYSGTISNYLIDLRDTPVDFEDEDFKDFCLFFPIALGFLIASILLSIFPALHPTYRQLQKYGRTVQKAAEKVNANYEEFGVEAREKNIIYLNDWLIKKSFFKNGIEKNYKKQPN